MRLNIFKKNADRIFHMVFFSLAFSLIGYFLPKTYFEFFDNRKYIEIKQPVPTEFNSYKRGEMISMIISRKSIINSNTEYRARLLHINGDVVATQLQSPDCPSNVLINKTNGYEIIRTNTTYIPCNAVPGRNLLQGIFTYEVNGVEKTYTIMSQVFEVTDEKTDRCK